MSAIVPAHGCATSGLDFADALAIVLDLATPLGARARGPADRAGRVLVEPFHTRLDLPDVDQSAIGRYTVGTADLTTGTNIRRRSEISAPAVP